VGRNLAVPAAMTENRLDRRLQQSGSRVVRDNKQMRESTGGINA